MTRDFSGTTPQLKNYRSYRLSVPEKAQAALAAAAGSAVIAVLFYDCIWVMLIMPVLYQVFKKRKIKAGIRKQQREICMQFLDAIRVVSSALFAGFSMENAWVEAQKEIANLYGENSMLCAELSRINRTAAMSVPIEGLLSDFADRTGVEDVISFAEVFGFAKRSGGDFAKIIETTVSHIRQKQETIQEIEILIAAKKLEQKVMDIIPVFILLYLRVTSGGYLDILYGNPLGAAFMTCALSIYIFAIYLAEKIMEITV